MTGDDETKIDLDWVFCDRTGKPYPEVLAMMRNSPTQAARLIEFSERIKEYRARKYEVM